MCDFQQSFHEDYALKFSFLFLLKLRIVKEERYITWQFLLLRIEYDLIGLLKLTDKLFAFIHVTMVWSSLIHNYLYLVYIWM